MTLAQSRDRLGSQVVEPNGVPPIEAPWRPAEQGEHPDRPLERWRECDGGETPEAGVEPGRLVGRKLLRGQVLNREDLIMLKRPA